MYTLHMCVHVYMYMFLAVEDRALKDALGNSLCSSSVWRATEKLYLEQCLEKAIECCCYVYIELYVCTWLVCIYIYICACISSIFNSIQAKAAYSSSYTAQVIAFNIICHIWKFIIYTIYHITYISIHIHTHIHVCETFVCMHQVFLEMHLLFMPTFSLTDRAATAPTHDRKMFAPCHCYLPPPPPLPLLLAPPPLSQLFRSPWQSSSATNPRKGQSQKWIAKR